MSEPSGPLELTVLIPTLNEGTHLAALLEEVRAAIEALTGSYEFLVIDGGSRDQTVAAAEAAGARVARQRGRGFGSAIREGLELSRGRWVLAMDADGSHPVRFFTELWARRERSDLVIASRFVAGGGARMPWHRYALSWWLNTVTRAVLGWSIRDSSSGLRLYRREAVARLPLKAEDFSVQQEVLAQLLAHGGRAEEIPFFYEPRRGGESKADIALLARRYLRMLFELRRLRGGWAGPACWALLLAAAAALRLWGAGWGFPLLLNGDEPHFVDLAVSFGAGSLDPRVFKYPTLWMYLLSACYGAYYLAWSAFGLCRSAAQFGALFVWQTWQFHLLGRLLAAGLSCLGLWAVARADREARAEAGKPFWPWAAALLAVAPGLVSSAHEAKPDSLMFCLSAAAWLWGLRLLRGGSARDAAAGGMAAGLALSAQYTALPALCVAPLALALRAGWGREAPGRALRLAALAAGASALGFALGCPYALLDFPAFRAGLLDHVVYKAMGSAAATGASWQAWANILLLAGPWSLAALAVPAGAVLLWRRDRTRLLLLAVPTLLWAAFLSRQHDGFNMRYLFACAPAIALLGAEGLSPLAAGRTLAAAALLALLPGLWASARADRLMTLPDTRQQATAWIAANIPPGAALLLDQPDASPAAPMTRGQAEELRRQNEALGSPRARYYELLRDSHPGIGWRVYRLKRSARDLWSNPRHVERSQSEGAYVDVGAGLAALRPLAIQYVVTSSYGARPETSPELAPFFAELSRGSRPLARFAPDGRTVVGPILEIRRLSP